MMYLQERNLVVAYRKCTLRKQRYRVSKVLKPIVYFEVLLRTTSQYSVQVHSQLLY